MAERGSMKEVKVFQYRVKDPITGRRYLTRYKLTEEDAAKRYPERERLETTEETRTIYDEDVPNSHQLVFGGQKKASSQGYSRALPRSA